MATRKSQIAGRWRITSTELWDQDFVDEEVRGYINFGKDGLGDIQFGYVRCEIDWRETDDESVAFSFEGMDEMEPCSGRGSAALEDGELDGVIYFHRGDESGFAAKRKR